MNPTPSQQALIDADEKTVLGIAGPGSGKTGTLVKRYCRLSAAGRAGRTAIVTFTNAAARELERRIDEAGQPLPWFCGTLHALCLRILRDAGQRSLTVLDKETSDALLKRCAEEAGCNAPFKSLRAAVSSTAPPPRPLRIAAQRYRRALENDDSVDYDIILVMAVELLRRDGGPRLDHLMVDEYQDASEIDSEIYGLLRAESRTVLGDPDQAIYGFRGGSLRPLTDMLSAPGVLVIKLEENFRSDQAVCSAAQKLIDRDPARFSKETIPVSEAPGWVGVLPGAPFATDAEETAAVIQFARNFVTAGGKKTLAVLCRYNVHRIAIAEQLTAAGLIPESVSDNPKDWSFAMLALSCWANPRNQITARAWIEKTEGATASARINEAMRKTGYVTSPFHGVGLSEVMTIAGLSRASRVRIKVAIEELYGTGEAGPENAGAIMVHLQESSAAGGEAGPIKVLTMHRAKGLEFDTVVLPAFEDDIIPGRPCDGVSEERRLAYVAMTRARHDLFISYSRRRRSMYGSGMNEAWPSRFLTE